MNSTCALGNTRGPAAKYRNDLDRKRQSGTAQCVHIVERVEVYWGVLAYNPNGEGLLQVGHGKGKALFRKRPDAVAFKRQVAREIKREGTGFGR